MQSTDDVQERLEAGDRKMDGLQEQIDGLRVAIADNTALTQQIHDSTADIVEFFVSVKGGFKVLNVIGRLAQPVGYIAAAVVSALGVWQAIRGMMR